MDILSSWIVGFSFFWSSLVSKQRERRIEEQKNSRNVEFQQYWRSLRFLLTNATISAISWPLFSSFRAFSLPLPPVNSPLIFLIQAFLSLYHFIIISIILVWVFQISYSESCVFGGDLANFIFWVVQSEKNCGCLSK